MLRNPTTVRTLRNLMENKCQTAVQQKVHFHYNHTDSCKFSRWTARECYKFMYARPWDNVVDFYADMVKGHTSLSGLFRKEIPADYEDAEIREDHEKFELVSFPVKDKSGRWARVNFKIVLSYHGGSFDGWQKQPDLNTVQSGPPTECFVFHARAIETSIPCAKEGSHMKTMCIELVANRFLRKMVRVLVATAIREAAAGADDDALLKLMDATCRRATAPPAPPDGLCLIDVGYTDYDRRHCLIP